MSWLEKTKRLLSIGGDALEERYSNPEGVLDRYIGELTNNLETAKAAITALRLEIQLLKNRARELKADEVMWERKAKRALTELKDEEVAREALRLKAAFVAERTELDKIVAGLENDIATMEKNLGPLDSKISEARAKRDRLSARKASEKARVEVRSQLGRSGLGEYEEVEEQLIELDAEAQTLNKLKLLSVKDVHRPASGADDDIEKELERIRRETSG